MREDGVSQRRIHRIAVTGGPGAGKTASIELARRTLCAHVEFVPESARIVFGGGFPREREQTAACAAQRAIFHVQRELEALFDARQGLEAVICDRGTVDGAAYWPSDPGEFFRQVGTTRATELCRYDLVIHLRPPAAGAGYHRDAVRTETAAEALRIDARIADAWAGHPRRVFIEHTRDFLSKARQVIAAVQNELSCDHPEAAV